MNSMHKTFDFREHLEKKRQKVSISHDTSIAHTMETKVSTTSKTLQLLESFGERKVNITSNLLSLHMPCNQSGKKRTLDELRTLAYERELSSKQKIKEGLQKVEKDVISNRWNRMLHLYDCIRNIFMLKRPKKCVLQAELLFHLINEYKSFVDLLPVELSSDNDISGGVKGEIKTMLQLLNKHLSDIIYITHVYNGSNEIVVIQNKENNTVAKIMNNEDHLTCSTDTKCNTVCNDINLNKNSSLPNQIEYENIDSNIHPDTNAGHCGTGSFTNKMNKNIKTYQIYINFNMSKYQEGRVKLKNIIEKMTMSNQ